MTSLRKLLAVSPLVISFAFSLGGCPQPTGGQNPGGDGTGNGDNSGGGGGLGGAGGGGGGNGGGGGGSSARVTPSSPTLFVGDLRGGIMSFKNPATLNGDVTPNTRVFGAFTIRDLVTSVTVDRTGNLLALSADNGIATFLGAETVSGDVQPNRRVSGAQTALTHQFTLNAAMLYDQGADRVFVCNSSAVLVWDNFASRKLNGNVAPDRTITSPDLFGPRGLALGPNGDLYVTSTRDVVVFRDGASRAGEIRADRKIDVLDLSAVIPGTTFNMDTVFVDRADRIYLFDTDPGAVISVLDNAASLNGVVPPNRIIDVDLPAAPGDIAPEFFPGAIAIDAAGVGYVSDFGQDAILVIRDIGARDGLLRVEQAIVGANTKFDEIGGLFLWE